MTTSGTIADPDTICALASGGAGRAGVDVFRISGPLARSTAAEMTSGRVPPARRASLRRLHDPSDDTPLDDALVVWMPAPDSFTGEDVVEFHTHGSVAVRAALLRVMYALGCRSAEPGEFTRRAFLNGRLDLIAVEGLADLIDAETEAQRRQALRQLEGGALGSSVRRWRERLLSAAAEVEASLDFSDEGDIPPDVAAATRSDLAGVLAEIERALAQGNEGERIRSGFMVAIAGPPNAGKSTLLNAIAGRDVAIVSARPGTTRDPIEVRCDLKGWPVTFVDTAGLRLANDEVEQEGIRRSRARLADADLVLWLEAVDAAEADAIPDNVASAITVSTKADLGLPVRSRPAVPVSAATGRGLPELLALVLSTLQASSSGSGDAVVTRERHRLALEATRDSLMRTQQVASRGPELLAEDIRLALRALGRLTGHVAPDEILDRIFSQFCIGK